MHSHEPDDWNQFELGEREAHPSDGECCGSQTSSEYVCDDSEDGCDDSEDGEDESSGESEHGTTSGSKSGGDESEGDVKSRTAAHIEEVAQIESLLEMARAYDAVETVEGGMIRQLARVV